MACALRRYGVTDSGLIQNWESSVKHDSNEIIRHIELRGSVAVVPGRSNRKEPRDHDRHLYKERRTIECTFGWLKYFRRIFSRFEKLKQQFVDYFVLAASIYRFRLG
jgi:hypothetical protein